MKKNKKLFIISIIFLFLISLTIVSATTTYNYWRENATTVWVNMNLTAGVTYNFNIASGSYTSNLTNVMDGGDDIESGTTTAWTGTTTMGVSTATKYYGNYSIYTTGAYKTLLYRKLNTPASKIIDIQIYNSATNDFYITPSNTTEDFIYMQSAVYSTWRKKSGGSWADTGITDCDLNTWCRIQFYITDNTIEKIVTPSGTITTINNLTSYNGFGTQAGAGTQNFDNLFIHKYNSSASITINCVADSCSVVSNATLLNYQIPLSTTLNSSTIEVIEGATVYINNITFINQTPSNITSTTLFSENINVTYAYRNESKALTNILLNYSISGSLSCIQTNNNTCVTQNNTYKQINYSLISTTNATSVVNYIMSLTENIIYPYITLLDATYFNQSHTQYNLGANDLYKTKFNGFNESINAFYYFETMTNVTSGSTADAYICNANYTTGDITSNVNCQEIYNFNYTNYNHTHGSYSAHNIIPFSIIDGKINGGIGATSTMYFIIRRISGTVQQYYITNTTSDSTTQTSANKGITWTPRTWTADAHLHYFPTVNNLYFNYQALGTFNGTPDSTPLRSELIDVIAFAPTPPIITNPFENSNQTTRYMNITYTNATTNAPLTNISYYNISLLDNNTTYLKTIIGNNGLNNSYYLDIYSENLSIGQYYIRVCAKDSLNQTGCNQEQFTLINNVQLNVTAYDSDTLAPIGNISLNITNLDTGITTTHNTTGYVISIDTIESTPYQVFFDTTSYAYEYVNYTTNSSSFQILNKSLAKQNSVLFNIYDEALGTPLVNVSCNITLQGSSTTNVYYTNTSTLFLYNLTADTYTVTGICLLYAQRQYAIVVTNRSTQTLNIYLVQSSNNVLFSYTDKDTGVVLEGVLVGLSKMINGSLTLVESRLTDVTGRTQFNVATNTLYSFTSTLTGYESKSFTLNPVIFTSYNVQLKKEATLGTPLDYGNVAVTYNPKQFIMGNNNFTIEIKGTGQLNNYGYSLSSSCNVIFDSDNNAYGSTFQDNITLTPSCTTNYDKLILFYYYETTDGTYRNFTEYLGITTYGQANYSSNMVTTLASGTYGMGLFERVLITTVIALILVGVVASIGGMVSGLFVGLIVLGYFTSVGFIPVGLVIITLFAGFVLVVSLNKRY